MAQGILNSSSAPDNLELFSSKDLEELKVGIKFPDEDTAVEAILGWGEKRFVFATITFNVQLLLYYQVVTFVIVQAHRKKDTSSTFQFTTATPLICGRWRVFSFLFQKPRMWLEKE